jgi:benzoyl-CoA reductase subunit D
MPITAGIDVGTGAIKVAVFNVENGRETCLSKRTERVRQRDPLVIAANAYDDVLKEAGLTRADVAYCATTGEGEALHFHTGHFYSMTTHARGAIYMEPEARAVIDIGALHGRAIRIDAHGKVLNYKMTSQCASGSGQFLENIARYLGIAQDEIGSLSKQSDNPEKVSGICAVLAETDVINMVSRGITAPNILKGIHESMADRLAKLRLQRLDVRSASARRLVPADAGEMMRGNRIASASSRTCAGSTAAAPRRRPRARARSARVAPRAPARSGSSCCCARSGRVADQFLVGEAEIGLADRHQFLGAGSPRQTPKV